MLLRQFGDGLEHRVVSEVRLHPPDPVDGALPLRRLGLPKGVKDWSLRSLQLKLIKIGGRVVRHARRIVFQLAEVAVPRDLFAMILERVSKLRLVPG